MKRKGCIENGKKAILIRKKVSHNIEIRRHIGGMDSWIWEKEAINGKFHNEKKALDVHLAVFCLFQSWGLYGKRGKKADCPDWP